MQCTNKVMNKCLSWILKIYIFFIAIPTWAGLPKPPDGDMASGSNSWLDVGSAQINKALSIGAIMTGAAILLGVAAGTLKAYHVAHEKGDLGYFFKMLLVGLLVAAVGIALVYAGYQIVSNK